AIAAVRAQPYRDFGVVVVDDASDDESAASAEAALAGSGVPARVVRLGARGESALRGDPFVGDGSAAPARTRRAPSGVAAARNVGARVLDARWLAFLDSDDLWLPQKLARQMSWLESRPQYRLAQT